MASDCALTGSDETIPGMGKLIVCSFFGYRLLLNGMPVYTTFAAAVQTVGSRVLLPSTVRLGRCEKLNRQSGTHKNPGVSSCGANGITPVSATRPWEGRLPYTPET